MTDKVAILVFKESGKYYTGDKNNFYDVPDCYEPWTKGFEEWIKTHEVTSPDNFTFLVLDHTDNKKFWMRLISPSTNERLISMLDKFYTERDITPERLKEVSEELLKLTTKFTSLVLTGEIR